MSKLTMSSVSHDTGRSHNIKRRTPHNSAAKLRLLLEKRQSLAVNKSCSDDDSQETLSMDDMATLLDDSYNLTKHLEEQVLFYQGTVNSLRERSEEIVKENESLYEKLKENLVSNALENKDMCPDQTKPMRKVGKEELESKMFEKMEHPEEKNIDEKSKVAFNFQDRQQFHQLGQEMDKVKKLNQEKSRRLETILQSTRDELQQYRELTTDLQSKIRRYETENGHYENVCAQCQTKDGTFSSRPSEAYTKTMDKLSKERDDLMEALVKQKSVLTQSQQREFEAYIEVKKSVETVEEAQLEKAQALIKIQQLRFSLEEEQKRQENALLSVKEKTKQELAEMKEDYEQKYSELQTKLQEQVQKCDMADNQLEKASREKVKLIAELEKTKAELTASRLDIMEVNDDAKQEVVKKTCEIVKSQQELEKLRSSQDRQRKEHEQEKVSLMTENEELRRRLVEAQNGWVESREESIRTLDKFKKIENDLQLVTLSSANAEKAHRESIEFFKKQQEEREKKFFETSKQKENEHVALRAELEEMLESQMKLTSTVQEESKKLTQKLEEKAKKHRSDKQQWQQEHSQLSVKHEKLAKQHDCMTKKNTEDFKMNKKLHNKVEFLKKENKKAMKTIYELLQKQSSLLKDRQHLSRELEQMKLSSNIGSVRQVVYGNDDKVITDDNSDNDNEDITISDGKLISEVHSPQTENAEESL